MPEETKVTEIPKDTEITPEKVPSPKEEPKEPPEEEEPLTEAELSQPYQTSELFYEVANLLGVEAKDFDAAREQLSVITDYAIQEAKSTRVEDIMQAIRKVEDTIQKPEWGTTRRANLYRYIRLASKRQSLDKALGAFQRGGFS